MHSAVLPEIQTGKMESEGPNLDHRLREQSRISNFTETSGMQRGMNQLQILEQIDERYVASP